MAREQTNLAMGVIGVGTMGQHHARVLSEMPRVNFIGVYDVDIGRAAQVCQRFGGRVFPKLPALLDQVEAVTIAAPTTLHAELAVTCLERGCHVLVEKPLAHNVKFAQELVKVAQDAGKTLMVGHIERYNPAIQALVNNLGQLSEPVLAIDAQRLSPFDGSRCLDVDVLHDLLVHDLDLALEIGGSEIISVSAVGRSVFSDKLDISNVQILFARKTWANLTTAKCSPKKMRCVTVYTPSRVLQADTLARSLIVHRANELPVMGSESCLMADIAREEIAVPKDEPLRLELEDFVSAICDERSPLVDGARGLRVLNVLQRISEVIQK